MTKLLFTAALACTVALAAHPVTEAGEHQIKRVSIGESEAGFWASGNVADVFNSQGSVEAIYCWVRGSGDYMDGFCFARDEKGRTFQCASMEEKTVEAMASIKGDSKVFFAVNRHEGKCGMVIVTNGSLTAPKRQTTPESDSSAIDTTGMFEVMQ